MTKGVAEEDAVDPITIYCLCGSTRFEAEYEAVKRELLEYRANDVILSVEYYTHQKNIKLSIGVKARLDKLHLKKIDIADFIIFITPGGYIGSSTTNELIYTMGRKKEDSLVFYDPKADPRNPCSPFFTYRKYKPYLREDLRKALTRLED